MPRSKLSEIDNNMPLEYLEISCSNINTIEYYPKLKDFIYNVNNKIMLSNMYKINKYYKQKDNRIIEFLII